MLRGPPTLLSLLSRGRLDVHRVISAVQTSDLQRFYSRSAPDPKFHKDYHQPPPPSGLQAPWEIVRLGTENGYLSWCRNGYLCTVLTLSLHAHDGFISDLSSFAFILAFYNMLMGTGGYIYNLTLQRPLIGHSRTSILFFSSMAVGHLIIWCVTFMVYIGFAGAVDDEDVEAVVFIEDHGDDDKK